MNKNEINKVLSDKIADLGVENYVFNSEDKFTSIGFDSIDFVELVIEIEKDLKISIPDDVLESASTVGALSDVISECLKKNNL